jgi:PadR family transcriptional regulator PadR
MNFQLGAALLDACVLAVLSREDTYGYVLTQSIKDVNPISESTLYPVLRRLEKDECLRVYDQPFAGRLRRYYSITEDGRNQLTQYREDWHDYKDKVDKLLGEGEEA